MASESNGNNKATSARRGKSSAEIIQQINIENAKFVAILLLSGMLIFHGVLKITSGNLQLILFSYVLFRLKVVSFIRGWQVRTLASGC